MNNSYWYITALDTPEEMVTLTCHGCDAEYELDMNDLRDIAVENKVTCECGELIDCRDLLLNTL